MRGEIHEGDYSKRTRTSISNSLLWTSNSTFLNKIYITQSREVFLIVLKKQPFRQYNEQQDAKDDKFTVRLGDDFSRAMLESAKEILEQEKDSTTLKQLALIGYANVIHDRKTATILAVVFKNKRNNKRHGVVTFDAFS